MSGACAIAKASFKIVPVTKRHPSIGGLVAEYIVAIDVTRVRFPADASLVCVREAGKNMISPVEAVRDTGESLWQNPSQGEMKAAREW